jgi:integrase
MGLKPQKWPKIYTRSYGGKKKVFVVDLGMTGANHRERKTFDTKQEADVFAEQARIAKQNEGTAAFSLSPDERAEASQSLELLRPHEVGLLTVAQYYLKHVIAFKTAPPIKDIVDQMIADAKSNNRRERTVSDLEDRLKLFAVDFGEQRLNDLTVADIEDWVDDENWGHRTRINYLTKISQLFNYAVSRSWVDENIVERIDRPNAEETEPGILTVPQAQSLLEHAAKHHLLPYIATGLFAGLRSAELLRLKGDAVNLKERCIVVGADVAKKRSRRVVEFNDTLHSWLEICSFGKSEIVNAAEFRDNLDSLRAAAGIEKWPHNGLRHSFASYHLAMYGDPVRTATLMGHRDSNVMHQHYKALVLKSEAEKYWALKNIPVKAK